jgi:hypothetical protein
MLTYPSILGRLLFSFAVCLLLCGIVSTEIPELLALTDNACNDFTIGKAGGRECTTTLSAAIHKSVLLHRKNFECRLRTHLVPIFVGTETISSNLFVLHSVLRR